MANTHTLTIWSTMSGKQFDRDMRDTDLMPLPADLNHDVDYAADPVGYLEHVFRYFNRVDEADVTRLNGIGYELPSLSTGDFVQVDGEFWLCANVGWQRVTMRQALLPQMDYATAVSMAAERGQADQVRPAMFLSVEGDTLVYMAPNAKWKTIPAEGATQVHDAHPFRP